MHSWFFLYFPRCIAFCDGGSGRGEEPGGEIRPPPDSDPFNDGEFGRNLANLSNQFAASANRPFQFQKRSQLFVRTHNKAPSVATVRVSNPNRSPLGING
jgi:hypothetical protein